MPPEDHDGAVPFLLCCDTKKMGEMKQRLKTGLSAFMACRNCLQLSCLSLEGLGSPHGKQRIVTNPEKLLLTIKDNFPLTSDQETAKCQKLVWLVFPSSIRAKVE